MTACHDPYLELELYLQKAQEEIGKAVKELEQHEECSAWSDSESLVLPPPPAFRSHTLGGRSSNRHKKRLENEWNHNTIHRICHDGNMQEFNRSPRQLKNSCTSYFSRLGPNVAPNHLDYKKNSNCNYSPNTRRRLWQMHPSLSFPETKRDYLLNAESTELKHFNQNTVCVESGEKLSNGYTNGLCNEADSRNVRQRSMSDTTPTLRFRYTNGDKDANIYPRPPSGDVNLLSIWADNLVLEIDKSLSGELNSTSSFSPSSDYSLSPIKHDDQGGDSDCSTPKPADCFKFTSSLHQSSNGIVASATDLKLVSPSPDSGIEHATCQTPEIIEDDIVDIASVPQNNSWVREGEQGPEFNYDSHFIEFEQVTPPPVGFEDKKSTFRTSVPTKRDREIQVGASQILKTANNVVEVHESSVTAFETKDLQIAMALSIAATTVEPDVMTAVASTCVVNEVPSMKEVISQNCSTFTDDDDDVFEDKLHNSRSRQFSSLRKTNSFKCDNWTTSLPKDSGRNVIGSVSPSQRSASSSAVSSITQVSMDELAAFMRRLKTNTCIPPQLEDVSTGVKITEADNKDAETQTTPVGTSRSSSFTWVTECDCSDWDLRSCSEGSLQMDNCTNCKKIAAASERLSPLPLSSDDDAVEDLGKSADSSSSLYLSACTGSSDSFDEMCPSDESKPSVLDLVIEENCQLRSMHQRGPTLEDISEEHVVSDTVSMVSSESNSCLQSPTEQCASFPSTLKSSRRNKSGQSPAQPIEPTVLVINELNIKSASAPVLMRQKRRGNSSLPESSSSDSSPTSENRYIDTPNQVSVPPRSHSAKELNELQAIEACSWLRAAGFPQYAQMYEDNLFPIDICTVQKDHAFLEADAIQSLFRRLNTLNRCAKMKYIDNIPRKSLNMDESDEDEQCALSENWEFQRSSRRWSRIPSPSDDLGERSPGRNHPQGSPKSSRHLHVSPVRKFLSPEEAYCSSHDSVFMDEQHSSPDSIRRSTLMRHTMTPAFQQIGDCSPGSSSGSGGTLEELQERSLRRSGSDRVREGAKALLRRMESLKGKRKKKSQHPVESSLSSAMQSGTDGSSSGSLASSPRLPRPQRQDTDTLAQCSYREKQKKKGWSANCLGDDMAAHSDSECPMLMFSEPWKDANSNDTKFVKHFVVPHGAIELASGQHLEPTSTYCKYIKPDSQQQKKRNLLHPSDCSPKRDVWDNDGKRGSYYDNISAPIVAFNDMCVDDLDKSDSMNELDKAEKASCSERGLPENPDDGEIIIINHDRRDSGVGSSLTRGITYEQAPWHCFPQRLSLSVRGLRNPLPIMHLTSPQILLVRKLALLKLTTVMEKYSPTSRTGWSWAVPKFIRRNKSPDYKDKLVFGVPLLVVLQRTGQPLPDPIEAAIHFLRTAALDSTGLFRKSGVRSRIQKLKSMTEKDPTRINYEEQQSYDVADMLKQYFRDLPEALMTNKLSETFISIFQYIPPELRFEAVQAAVMLMPDENREVLHSLLGFLREVCGHSGINQMTATNLAVCLAPSLFHLSTPRSASSSPRRRKTVGVPDLRELNETRAAYECLACMLVNFDQLFTVPEELVTQNRISSAGHFEPAANLQELSSIVTKGKGGWHDYVDSCLQVLLKEAKERYRGWVNYTQTKVVDTAFKKLSDEHPLRLWKISTDVEAPPIELLNRLLRERNLWDSSFVKGKVVCRLDKQTEIFQYLVSCPAPHPNCNYCILRSWRIDLPRGACALIEASVEHPEAEVVSNSVRAVVLASRYLIEPCGSGKSRITHISRIDFRGRTPEWYNRAYGHISELFLMKLRNSFRHTRNEGPETKV